MQEHRYSLSELSEITSVEPRTIRHYISLGLMRGPDALGRNAYYTDYHRKRIETVRQLKEHYGLPLSEIRRYFQLAAPDEEIRIVPLSGTGRPPAASAFEGMTKETTEHYVGAAPTEPERSEIRHDICGLADTLDDTRGSTLDELLVMLREELGSRPVSRSASTVHLNKIDVTPEISLLVTGEFDALTLSRIERLADYLREILNGGLERKKGSDT